MKSCHNRKNVRRCLFEYTENGERSIEAEQAFNCAKMSEKLIIQNDSNERLQQKKEGN